MSSFHCSGIPDSLLLCFHLCFVQPLDISAFVKQYTQDFLLGKPLLTQTSVSVVMIPGTVGMHQTLFSSSSFVLWLSKAKWCGESIHEKEWTQIKSDWQKITTCHLQHSDNRKISSVACRIFCVCLEFWNKQKAFRRCLTALIKQSKTKIHFHDPVSLVHVHMHT